MPDDADVSQERMEREAALDRREREARLSRRELLPNGTCHNPRCEDEFGPGDMRAYCNSECAAEHELWIRNNGRG